MEGHLYQRGKSKIWYLLYDAPLSNGEKRNLRSVRIGKMSKGEADAKKREILSKVDKNPARERATSTTVAQFLQSWLDATRDRLAPRTAERYASIVELHVLPVIGGIKLSKLAPEHLRKVYRAVHDKAYRIRPVYTCTEHLTRRFNTESAKIESSTRTSPVGSNLPR